MVSLSLARTINPEGSGSLFGCLLLLFMMTPPMQSFTWEPGWADAVHKTLAQKKVNASRLNLSPLIQDTTIQLYEISSVQPNNPGLKFVLALSYDLKAYKWEPKPKPNL
jgi:hypothetical protein